MQYHVLRTEEEQTIEQETQKGKERGKRGDDDESKNRNTEYPSETKVNEEDKKARIEKGERQGKGYGEESVEKGQKEKKRKRKLSKKTRRKTRISSTGGEEGEESLRTYFHRETRVSLAGRLAGCRCVMEHVPRDNDVEMKGNE